MCGIPHMLKATQTIYQIFKCGMIGMVPTHVCLTHAAMFTETHAEKEHRDKHLHMQTHLEIVTVTVCIEFCDWLELSGVL